MENIHQLLLIGYCVRRLGPKRQHSSSMSQCGRINLLLLLSAFVVYWEIAKEQHLSEVIAVYDCCCRTDYQVIGEASGSKVR